MIYFLPYSVNTNSSVLKVCCGNKLCKGCMWGIIESVGNTNQLDCPFCRTLLYETNKEYMVWLKERADLKEANSGAMLNLGSHYYHGTLSLSIDIAKEVKLWIDSAGMLNDKEACLNLALHYSKVVKDGTKA